MMKLRTTISGGQREKALAIFHANEGLVGLMVQRLTRCPEWSSKTKANELFVVGLWGLWLAVLRFDASLGNKFSTFACKYILGYLQTYTQRQCNRGQAGVALTDLLPQSWKGGGGVPENLSPAMDDLGPRDADTAEVLRLLTQNLPAWKRDLVEMRYLKDMTFEEIGDICGKSHEWVRQKVAEGLTQCYRRAKHLGIQWHDLATR